MDGCRPFKSRVQSKKSNTEWCWTFLAGALGLEPRAYGFGDEADKSASGGTTFEVLISTIQEQIAAAFTKSDQKQNKLGISVSSLRFSSATV